MEAYQSKLGSMLYRHGNKCIYEGGICDEKRTILWNDVKEVYIGGTKTSVYFIPAYESRTIQVIDYHKNKVAIRISSPGRVGSEKKWQFVNIYAYIVSNIIDRQWEEFMSELRKGKRVFYIGVELGLDSIWFPKLFRGHDVIALNRIRGCEMDTGWFYISYWLDEKYYKRKDVGPIEMIPNLHLLQRFIDSHSNEVSPVEPKE